jgi:hypothetical protein
MLGAKTIFSAIIFLLVSAQTLDYGLLWLVFYHCATEAGEIMLNHSFLSFSFSQCQWKGLDSNPRPWMMRQVFYHCATAACQLVVNKSFSVIFFHLVPVWLKPLTLDFMASVIPLCYCKWQTSGKPLFSVILFLTVPVAVWTQTVDFGCHYKCSTIVPLKLANWW